MNNVYVSQWSTENRFNLALLSYTLGIINIRNGPVAIVEMKTKGAAVVPMTIVSVLISIPIIFFELSLGQYSNRSAIEIWDLCPLFRGVGYSTVLVFGIAQTYYTTLCTYSFYFILTGVNYNQDMKNCHSNWGTANCTSRSYNLTFDYEAKAMGAPQLDLMLFGLLPPIFVFFANSNVPKSIDRLNIGFHVIPLICLVILFLMTFIGQGGTMGLIYLSTVDLTSLLSWKEWATCITNSLWSAGVGMGAYITFGTFCPFRNAIYLKSISVAGFDVFMTLICTFVVVNIVGSVSIEEKVPIEEVINEDRSLLFAIVPQGLQLMPWAPQLWMAILYLAIFIMGLRSQTMMVCICINHILRVSPSGRLHTALTGFICCCVIYVSSILLFTPIGYQIVAMIERTLANYMIPFLTSVQLCGVMYVYGMQNFMEDIHFMLGIRPPEYWKISYALSPLVIMAICISNFINFLQSDSEDTSIIINFLQYTIMGFPIFITVAVAIFHLVTKGISKSARPTQEWGPAEHSLRKSRQMFKTHNMTKEYMYRQERLMKTGR